MTATTIIDLDALGPEFIQDPHPTYAQLREQAPVHRVRMPGGMEAWLVVGFAQAKELLADHARLSNDWRHAPWGDPNASAPHMLIADPPDHTRLRKLVSKEFTPRRIAELGPRVKQITGELIDAMLASPDGRADLVEDFAFPLPASVICELLGIPRKDHTVFRDWSRDALKQNDPEKAAAAMGSLAGYLTELIEEKRSRPQDQDMLAALVRAKDDDDALTAEELVGMSVLLLVAGHETTSGLLSAGLATLLQHPDQLAALRADWSLLDGAVEEMARYVGPTGTSLHRFTLEPVAVGDVVIPGGGQIVLIGNTAANRDPAQFTDPERFDIRRQPASHLSFGHGIHFCLGAQLARLEVRTAIRMLLERCPDLALADEPLVWHDSIISRGLVRVLVRTRTHE